MTLLETLASKAQTDLVYEMTLEELIAWYGSRSYSPIGQATLNRLEQLQIALESDADVERQAANAQLIVAARDLLEALKFVRALWEKDGEGGGYLAIIVGAIDKAEGRATAEPKRKAYSSTQGGPEYDAP